MWRTIKSRPETEISPANYRTYIADTRPIAFGSDTGCLLVEAASPLVATQLNNYFDMTIRRAIVTTNASIQGVPVAAGALYPFVGLLLNPAIAAGAMGFSSVLVVTNSLKLRGFRPSNI